jgi:uncharacterized protein YbbC (DUF1343 family)
VTSSSRMGAGRVAARPTGPRPAWRSGLERLCNGLAGREPPLTPELMARVRRAAGLLTHPAGVTCDLIGGVEALSRAGAGLVALFGPEHGVRGDAPDGRAVPSQVDARSGLPVHSLYHGGPLTSEAPTPGMFEGLEVLLIDLQDVGARFYTFASTVSLCMAAAADAGVPVVLLDRPNPIGTMVEGPLLRAPFRSFVGLHPVPIRHGCTLGELALLFHRAFGVGDEPSVVASEALAPCGGSEMYSQLAGTGALPWVPPSPNMPTPLTALLYPGTALLEGTNVSEGRGTPKPFEWLGAPWVVAEALTERLRSYSVPGAVFRPVHFIPTASKWSGERCGGVQVYVTDPLRFRPVLTGVAVLCALHQLWPAEFSWRASESGFAVDRLAGTDHLRLAIDGGEQPAAIAAAWSEDEAAFMETCAAHLGGPEQWRVQQP